MHKLQSEGKNNRENNANYHFDKLLKISLLIGIFVVSGFIIYYLFSPEPGYYTFGILNSEKRAENYPTNATVGENVSVYCTVGNYLNRDLTFHVKVLRGDNTTIKEPEGSINATFLYNTSRITLNHKKTWISKRLNVLFPLPGPNQSIIVELWEILSNSNEKYLEILWVILTIFP